MTPSLNICLCNYPTAKNLETLKKYFKITLWKTWITFSVNTILGIPSSEIWDIPHPPSRKKTEISSTLLQKNSQCLWCRKNTYTPCHFIFFLLFFIIHFMIIVSIIVFFAYIDYFFHLCLNREILDWAPKTIFYNFSLTNVSKFKKKILLASCLWRGRTTLLGPSDP